jgi:hypothetical protein
MASTEQEWLRNVSADAERLEAEQAARLAELLKFCKWICKGEFGEGREREIVGRYLAEGN